MQPVSTAQEQLNDTQESLAAALAQIQALRLRQRGLEKRNVYLRNLLRKHGVNPTDEVDAIDVPAPQPTSPGQHTVRDQAAPSTAPPSIADHDLGRDSGHCKSTLETLLHQVKPRSVVFLNEGERAAGHVFISDDVLEFIEVKARVTPEEFVGVRFLNHADGQRPGSGGLRSAVVRPTWWDSLFGSSAGKGEDGVHSADAAPPRAPQPPASWQSVPKAKRQSDSAPPPPPPPPPAAHGLHMPTLSEGLSSLATLTEYLQHNLIGDSPRGAEERDGEQDATPASSGFDCGGELSGAPGAAEQSAWQIIWKESRTGALQTVTFEAQKDTRMAVQRKVEQWGDRQALSHEHGASASGNRSATGSTHGVASRAGGGAARTPSTQDLADLDASPVAAPEHLLTTHTFLPRGSAESSIITAKMATALAGALPGRLKLNDWKLLYSTDTGGFSLQSLYRAGAHCSRSLLIVKDFYGHVFGAFCTESWRISPRYQGTGECFVFQLWPHMVKYSWQRPTPSQARNDFFMLLAQDSIGIGGGPHFAVWLDSDLLHGNSGVCDTFGSPVLSGAEDYKVKNLELWQVGVR